ncbi:MAG: SDR family NAD(P)-dependent oxidoreductase [Pseudomonadota bacterium]
MLSPHFPHSSHSSHPQLAVVTGAGSGIGLALSRALAARNIEVIAIDCDINALAGFPGIQASKLDVSDASGMQQLADALAHRPLHYLFANAGIGAPGTVLFAPLPAWQRAWDVNVMGVLHSLRCWWPQLLAGQGKAVATVSSAALQCYPGAALYRATKAALLSALESLHYEGKESGVAIHALCPGLVQSNIAASARASIPAGYAPPDPFSAWLAHAMKTAETAEHFAARVLHALIDAEEAPPFYWFTHPDSLAWIQGRHHAIMGGQPFADFGVGP